MKHTLTIFLAAIVGVMLVFAAVSCAEAGNPTEPGSDDGYKLGDFQLRDTGPAGGLIFYIDEADEFDWTYLEAAPQSTQWTDKPWGDYGTEIGGDAALTGLGDGQAATDAIVAHMSGEGITGTAAQICDELDYNDYKDWFLPSQDELGKIFVNLYKGTDENGVTYTPVGSFSSALYWSSSEYSSNNALLRDFRSGGSPSTGTKQGGSLLRIRAVRAF